MQPYPSKITQQMQQLFNSLSEKDQRRYAAIEALKLGHGGIKYVSELFPIDPKTVRKGIAEFNDNEKMEQKSIRKKGVDANR